MEKLISAVIIAKDEEKMLPACLASLSWVDEIVLIDTGSTDKTVAIAKKHGARVIPYLAGKSFSDWRNKGLREASGRWIFYIDADERVPKKLAQEMRSLALNQMKGSFDWFVIPRSNTIFGRQFRHGGWWPDYVKRFFKRSHLEKWTGLLHEEPVVKGEMGYLKNYLLHEKNETVFEMVEKTNKWSAIEGQLMFDAKHPPMNIPRFMTAMFREFWYRFITKRGFLDGWEGIIMGMYQVFSRFCSYAKLWELQLHSKGKV